MSAALPTATAGDASVRLQVVAIEPETADVKTFTFRPLDRLPAYEAGQAMTLRLPVDGAVVSRTFSLASAPGEGDTLAMTIKAQPGGVATRWLHSRLKPGDVVEAGCPRGRFTLAVGREESVALLSAGSGASPLMSMLRRLAVTQPDANVVWFHAARTPEDVLFARPLAALQHAMPRLRVAVTVSRPAPGWFGYSGRAGRRLLSVAVPDLGRRQVYCCGPEGFMQDMRLIHGAEGGPREAFRTEHFGAPPPAPAAAVAQAPDGGFSVALGGKLFRSRPDETLLEAATRQQVVIPCGCASGMCGTCRVTLLDGRVAMHHNGGLSPEEEAEHYILACSARPLTDLAIAL
ncbi:2Fe-2S iron-sulfur cluster-binding protein [Ancylobacter moscoviensis]